MRKKILILILVCFSTNVEAQDDIDTLQLFPDTTTFINTSTPVIDWISNVGIKFNVDTCWTQYTIEKILVLFYNSDYPPWDTTHHSTEMYISLELNNFPVHIQTVTIDTVYPYWKFIRISPELSITNHNYFYVTGGQYLYLARSYYREDTLYYNQFYYYWEPEEWHEGIDFYYPIKAVVKKTSPIGIKDKRPNEKDFVLYQNYPNPFNPNTTFSYNIPCQSYIAIDLFNVLGKKTTNLFSGKKPPGKYSLQLNSKDFSLTSGVYFVRIRAIPLYEKENIFQKTIKIVLTK